MAGRQSEITPVQRFVESSSKCLVASSQLQGIIAYKSQGRGESHPGKVSHSQPPWNSAVAFSFMEFHQLTRKIEHRFQQAADLPVRPRGVSDINTARALEMSVKLTAKIGESIICEAVSDLDRWLGRALIILGELELPQRLPRLPGKREPSCPFCTHRSLRMLPLRGVIICIMPVELCHDDNGKKPRAQMEWSSFAQEYVLRWQDGIAGLPVENEAA